MFARTQNFLTIFITVILDDRVMAEASRQLLNKTSCSALILNEIK